MGEGETITQGYYYIRHVHIFNTHYSSSTHLATVNPREDSERPLTISWATFTIELPQAALGPLNPSSVPNGFGGFLTPSIGAVMVSKMKIE